MITELEKLTKAQKQLCRTLDFAIVVAIGFIFLGLFRIWEMFQ